MKVTRTRNMKATRTEVVAIIVELSEEEATKLLSYTGHKSKNEDDKYFGKGAGAFFYKLYKALNDKL